MAWAKVLLGHGTQLSYSSGNDFVKRNVFNCLLKEKREVAVDNVVTLVGRLFHVRAAITRKHLSPMVRSRDMGTIRRGWEPDRSRCSDSAWSTWSVWTRWGLSLTIRYGCLTCAQKVTGWSASQSYFHLRVQKTWTGIRLEYVLGFQYFQISVVHAAFLNRPTTF